MGGIGDMDDKALALLDVFHGLVGFGQVEGHAVAVEHGAPRGVHHINSAVFIVSSHEQNRHRENGFGYFNGLFHNKLIIYN